LPNFLIEGALYFIKMKIKNVLGVDIYEQNMLELSNKFKKPIIFLYAEND